MTGSPGRPLPLLTDQNEFFWTSGADGRLRIQECTSCAALIHPPQPVCRYCRGHDLGVREVSGHATLIGFTVNHRFGLPGLPAPYVVAQVALEEDPRVRLTTNAVECDPAQLALGMRMEVVFEQVEDVWLPLFRPTAEQGEPARLPEDEPEVRIRPMVTREKFEDKAAITGIGSSELGRRLMVPPLSLTLQACERAIADAGLALDDIDGLATYPGAGAYGGFGEGGITALESALGIRPTWYNGGSETFGPGGSLIAAMLAVAGGLARHVLCFRTLWEASYGELVKRGRLQPPSSPDAGWLKPFGAISAAHTLAQNAQRHFHRYGTTRETLGWIALNQRANAALHPTAIYRDPMTMDDYLEARPITTPFGLYDCDVPCDGAVAVIVSAVDTARDLARPPVLVEAVGTQITERLEWDQSTLTHEPQVLGQSAHLWSRTSLRPADVDVAQLYDGFTFNCLSWIEALGFCGIGEAKDFLDGGKNIARDGVLPLNTHGGQLSHGRTHGMGLVHEAIVQLRGDGGARQVPGARVAVVSSGGLTPSGVLLLRTDT
ncbi:thiolase C-terminal domain-containing protein [Streptomyces fulvoviolaceus]|uniref:thiolase C-terminal domain-containing protein n=1 Tax=Streptomyces fulvoviolaceus TaxID=285535 RepID=UPI0004C60BCA|nr:OB-fold domain-containing protein [Streptomyces fulvoviolaceus]MCT9083293.1 OB-fold domain-containing protein [Streptomyces fulvoviolaceus]